MKCTCGNRDEWEVVHYKTYEHHINGRGFGTVILPSKSSLIRCNRCGAEWRTAAKYVESLLPEGTKPFYTKIGEVIE